MHLQQENILLQDDKSMHHRVNLHFHLELRYTGLAKVPTTQHYWTKHAVRNIPKTDFLPISGINVYDIIRRNFLVISEKALLGINERFRNE